MFEILLAVVFNAAFAATNPVYDMFNPVNVDGITLSPFY
jgi:hypothetical protein